MHFKFQQLVMSGLKRFNCDLCDKQFSSLSNVKRHKNHVHEQSIKVSCEICSKIFSKEYLKWHMQSHGIQNYSLIKNFKCPLCFNHISKEDISDHFLEQHEITLKSYKKEFEDMNEFQKWKQDFEESERSSYRKPRSSYQRVDGSLVHHYNCHRSGNYVEGGKGKRHAKAMGSNKINSSCPSRIKVIENCDGRVSAFITETHVGHETDISRLPIPKTIKDDIAHKIASKVPFDKILDDYRANMSDSLQRSSLITKIDLRNIATSYNLKHEAVIHDTRQSADFISVEAFVKEMEAEGEKSIIKFFKPDGKLSDNYPQLQYDDFFLIVMAKAQIELLKEFGNNLICINGTHVLNSYDVELVTVMVIDELYQGFPVAFLFTNRTDASTIEVFYLIVKEAVGFALNPSVFMSDTTDVFYDAWCNVMGPVKNRLFCSWHVLKEWSNNLNKINTKEKRTDVYKLLKVISVEPDENTFNIMLENIIENLKTEPDTQEFGNYFHNTYGNCTRAWAYCYRTDVDPSTNLHLEKMHSTIQSEYLKGKKLKSFDIGLQKVIRYFRNKLFDRMITLVNGRITSKVMDLRRKHKAAVEQGMLAIKTTADQDVVNKLMDQWCVTSSNGTKIYDVVPSDTDCNCEIYCDICKFCVHAFQCSCPDSTSFLNMCKHIHTVGIEILKESEKDCSRSNSPVDNVFIEDNVRMTSDNEIGEQELINANSEQELINANSSEVTCVQEILNMDERIEMLRQCCERMLNGVQNEAQLNYLEKTLFPSEKVMFAMGNLLQGGIPKLKYDTNSKKRKKTE